TTATIPNESLVRFDLSNTEPCLFFQENGLSFSLEAVKRLQELTLSRASAGPQNPRLRTSTVSLCADPMLPQEFLPICKQRGASASLSRLAMVPLDVCEICAFAACTGC
uniref:Guanylate cyclase activator 2B n=1 Tax=Scophthalmus maximus TaxID=52904 RepID=A0A8D2ZF89_SCOMX